MFSNSAQEKGIREAALRPICDRVEHGKGWLISGRHGSLVVTMEHRKTLRSVSWRTTPAKHSATCQPSQTWMRSGDDVIHWRLQEAQLDARELRHWRPWCTLPSLWLGRLGEPIPDMLTLVAHKVPRAGLAKVKAMSQSGWPGSRRRGWNS